jgi:hypothetical protein
VTEAIPVISYVPDEYKLTDFSVDSRQIYAQVHGVASQQTVIPPTHSVCVCWQVSSRRHFKLPKPHSPRHYFAHSTHHQHVICVLCIQQISNCDAHLFVSLFVITFLHNNRQEAVPYWLMSSTCHAHHWIHLRAIIWHLFVVALTSRLGEKPSTSLSLPHWYSNVRCELKLHHVKFMLPVSKILDKFF